jgi:hypothetical protein
MPSVSIIDTLTGLPLGVLTPSVDTLGPYGPGNHRLTQWRDGATTRNVSDTFGVVVQISGAIAPQLGRAPGFDDGGSVNLQTYHQRITQLATLHQLLGGAWVPTQTIDIYYAPQLVRWVESLPGVIGLYVGPTWSVDLYYLKTI